MTTKSKTGYYLYAISENSGPESFDGLTGIADAPVFRHGLGKVAAIVSECSLKKIRPERRNLLAHNAVLKRMVSGRTILPMALGIIADSLDDVNLILELNAEAFLEQLARVDGCLEMGLRVKWDVPNIFEYFVSVHPELREARDRLMPNDREPLQEEKIEIGQLFDRLLNQEREENAVLIEDAMEEFSRELKRLNPLRDLTEVVNFAFLVEKDKLDDHEMAVFKAANKFDNSFRFDYNGPWAPHNFVDIDLKLKRDEED